LIHSSSREIKPSTNLAKALSIQYQKNALEKWLKMGILNKDCHSPVKVTDSTKNKL
jgi:hypothetical protein